MSRRKQTNPRAIKRDISQNEDENSLTTVKKVACESIRSDSVDSTVITEDEQKYSTIKCDNCQEIFLTSEQFNRHRLYTCSFLTENINSEDSRTSSYDDYAHLIDHTSYESNQNEEYPYQCSYCNKSFANMALLLKHEQIHVELMPFRCSCCGKGFKHRRSLNRHSKLHTGERKFKCQICESTFARSDHLKAHIRTHNNTNTMLSNDKSLKQDFRIKTPLNVRTNSNEHRISSDIKTATKDINKTEHCPYCPRICLGENSLKIHIQNEHNPMDPDESFSDRLKSECVSPALSDTYCYLCNAKFNNRENYYAHLRCTHPSYTAKSDHISFLPIIPIKTLQDNTDDTVLNEYAHIEKVICCEKCKRSFDSMSIYLQHYSVQHGLQIFKCLQCDDIFENLDLFFSHIERIHPSKTVETFKCKICNANYKQRTDFLHHVQTIHKTLLYSCSLCSSQLNSVNELNDHLKYIHKVNSFNEITTNLSHSLFNTLIQCNYCTIKFNSKTELNQHMSHEHNDQERNIKSDEQSNNKIQSKQNSTDTVCSLCNLTFSSEIHLFEHNKHKHRASPPSLIPSSSSSSSFKCSYCHALFTSRIQLDRHSRIHIASSGNNLKCNICDRSFPSIDILSEHKLSHCKATTSNICSYCHQILNDETDYTRHLYEHNNQCKMKRFTNNNDNLKITITCIVCKQSLINDHEIDLHSRFHLNQTVSSNIKLKDNRLITMSIKCNQCHRSINSERNFLLELPSFNVICFICIENDIKTKDLYTIPDIELTSTSISCPKCRNNTEFDSIKTYQQHFVSVHQSKNSNEEYHCFKCNKIVSSHQHILQHMFKKSSLATTRSFSPPRVHYCYLCQTNFDTAIKMHIHLIEHQYPNHDYQCNICSQSVFNDASQLYNHMVQHGSKARLYPCRGCDVYFMFSIHLINHQYSHQDETVFTKTNENAKMSKYVSNDNNDNSYKTIATRSSTKGTCRSVIVS